MVNLSRLLVTNSDRSRPSVQSGPGLDCGLVQTAASLDLHHCLLCIHKINNKYVYEKFGNVKIGLSVLDYPYIAVESKSLRSF